MKIQGLSALVCAVALCAANAPAMAGISPYVRMGWGGSQLRMAEGNDMIQRSEDAFQEAGLPADFTSVPAGYGPNASAGLWLFHGLRVGATYSRFRSAFTNSVHVPGTVFYADQLQFDMTEVGAELAVRIPRLAGLTIGGTVASGKAEMVEGFSIEDGSGQYYRDTYSSGTKTTYGGFIGLDQTNSTGIAGFARVGYWFRDMGSMPSQGTESDGFTTLPFTGTTIPLDYSGVYVTFGIGFDLAH